MDSVEIKAFPLLSPGLHQLSDLVQNFHKTSILPPLLLLLQPPPQLHGDLPLAFL